MSASLRSVSAGPELLAEALTTDLTAQAVSGESVAAQVAKSNRAAADSIVRTDLELVDEVKRGSRPAFSELVRRHQRGLLRIVLRLTRELPLAEDIVQETFIKAYEKMHLFEGRSSFKSWLYQVGLNTAKNRFRSRPPEEFTTDVLQGGVEAGAERGLVKGDMARLLRSAIDELPERQRVSITLRVFEDLSFKEIAQIMNCPYDTAKANYRHALLKLRETFEQQMGKGGDLENWNSLFGDESESSMGSGFGGSFTRTAIEQAEVEL